MKSHHFLLLSQFWAMTSFIVSESPLLVGASLVLAVLWLIGSVIPSESE